MVPIPGTLTVRWDCSNMGQSLPGVAYEIREILSYYESYKHGIKVV